MRIRFFIFLLACIGSCQSALVWQGDFSSYSNNSTITTNNSTGTNDTYASTALTGGITGINFTSQDAVAPFSTGEYGVIAVTGSGTTGNVTLRRRNLATYGALVDNGEVRVLSLDIAQATGSSMNFTVNFMNSSNTSLGGLSSIGGGSIPTASLLRVTAVYNQSGGDITLPGSLGTLNTQKGALYSLNNSGTYTLVVNNAAQSTSGAGFSIQWQGADNGETAYFDNLGFWSSTSDTWNGVNVLQLTPGTDLSSVPEVPIPSLAVLLLALIFMNFQRNNTPLIKLSPVNP